MKKTYLKYLNALALTGILASFAVLSSCSSDDSGDAGPTQTIWELIEADANLSLLAAEFANFADIEATLSDEDGNITVFAPSNAALNVLLGNLGLDNFSTVSEDIARAVLTYHIVTSGALASADLSGTITTQQGEAITVTADGLLDTGATDDAEFGTTDIQATNGVIHVVDVVLVPPTIGAQIVATLGRISQSILLGADFTTLAAGMLKADAAQTDATATIVALLTGDITDSSPTQITFFAPTNATFTAAGFDVDSFTAEQWDAIIRNHIVVAQGGTDGTAALAETDLTTGAMYYSAYGSMNPLAFFNDTNSIPADNGIGIFIDGNQDVDFLDTNTFTNFDAEVVVLNAVDAENGAIHVIAGVLSPFPASN